MGDTYLQNVNNFCRLFITHSFTNSEIRKMRPHMDLCADVPMEGLHMEVQAIQESMQLLSDKLDHARLVHVFQLFRSEYCQ
jgi:hypothetical protein